MNETEFASQWDYKVRYCQLYKHGRWEYIHPKHFETTQQMKLNVLRLPHSHAGNHRPSVYGNLTT